MVDLLNLLYLWAQVYPEWAALLVLLFSFYGFIYYAGVVRVWDEMLIGQKIVASPPLVVFGLVDVLILRCILGTIIFIELPTMATITFSKQCESHMDEDNWRGKIARAFCFLLNTFIRAHCQGRSRV